MNGACLEEFASALHDCTSLDQASYVHIKSIYVCAYIYVYMYIYMYICIHIRLSTNANNVVFLRVLPPFTMPPLTYCKASGPKHVVAESLSKKSSNKPRDQNTRTYVIQM